MDPTFRKAIRAEQARIVCLGVKLRPITLGHLFLLHEEGNAFPEHAKEAEWPDLVQAVLVCSQRSASSARRMIYGRLAWLWAVVWGWCNRKTTRSRLKRTEVYAAFCDYLGEQLGRPEPDDLSPGGAGELRAPMCWRLLAMLMADFGLSRKEALKTPVAFALTLWATEADRRGVSKLASERQIGFRAWVRQMEAKRLGAGSGEQGAKDGGQI